MLTQRERTVLYEDIDSKRILGFCPEGGTPVFPQGIRWKSTVLNSSFEIESAAKRFRAEQQKDREEATYRQIMREAPFRKAIREALIERSRHLDAANRNFNYAMLEIMDCRYRQVMAEKNKVASFLPAEKYEESKSGDDVALEALRGQ